MQPPIESSALGRVRRRRLALGITGVLLPVLLLALERSPWSVRVNQGILLAWCALYAVTVIAFVFTRCPRCHHLFHSVYPSHDPLARRCRGCGLELSADRRTRP